jgi:hypothetical protein
VRGPPGASFAGLQLWIGPALHPIEAMASQLATACDLAPDGRFELGELAAGTLKAYLLLPVEANYGAGGFLTGGDNLNNRLELGTLELGEGETLERDFAVEEFPGTMELTVLVNGRPASGTRFNATRGGVAPGAIKGRFDVQGDMRLSGETGPQGVCGPVLAFPGTWTVSVYRGSGLAVGWRHSTPVHVAAASATRATISIDVAEGTLRFLDADGNLLAGRTISAFLAAPDPFRVAQRTTDDQGRATFTLASGDHRFRLDSGPDDPFLDPEEHTVTLTWTAQGPLVEDVRF